MATVLQVLPRLGTGGGVERGTVDIARHLQASGWRALVASATGPLAADINRCGGKHLDLPLDTKSPLALWINATRLARVVRKHGVDLVHARSRGPAWSAAAASRRTGVPFVTTFHAVYSGYDQGLKQRYNAVLASGQRVIAISDYVAKHLREVYGVGDDRLRTIHRGVDLAEFDPDRVHGLRIQTLAERWRLDPDKRVVMAPGRLAKSKGHAWFLQAFAKLDRADTVAVIVGGPDRDGDYANDLDKLVRKLGLVDRVIFAGACADMPAAYWLADIVVATPIRPEAFGRVSIEAQAMRKPIIAADDGGLPETLRHGLTGWLVPSGKVDVLTQTMEEALDLSADQRAEIGRRGRRLVAERFSLEQMGSATLAVYAELLGSASGLRGAA